MDACVDFLHVDARVADFRHRGLLGGRKS
jgi:hypothetical protein